MSHKAHPMSRQGETSTSTSDKVSNHMMSHEDGFRELRKPDRPGYVEIEVDTTHSIEHIGNIPFGNDDK